MLLITELLLLLLYTSGARPAAHFSHLLATIKIPSKLITAFVSYDSRDTVPGGIS